MTEMCPREVKTWSAEPNSLHLVDAIRERYDDADMRKQSRRTIRSVKQP